MELNERLGVRLGEQKANLLEQYCDDFNQPVSVTIRRSVLSVLVDDDHNFDFEDDLIEEPLADKAYHFRVSEKTRENLEEKSEKLDVPMSDIIREAVDESLWRAGY